MMPQNGIKAWVLKTTSNAKANCCNQAISQLCAFASLFWVNSCSRDLSFCTRTLRFARFVFCKRPRHRYDKEGDFGSVNWHVTNQGNALEARNHQSYDGSMYQQESCRQCPQFFLSHDPIALSGAPKTNAVFKVNAIHLKASDGWPVLAHSGA